jgi:hypothetical protein
MKAYMQLPVPAAIRECNETKGYTPQQMQNNKAKTAGTAIHIKWAEVRNSV